MRYTYTIIRFVPNPGTGEFVNIGAVVGSDIADDWSGLFATNLDRAKKLNPQVERAVLLAAADFMDELSREIDNTADYSGGLFGESLMESALEDLYRDQRNIIQFSNPAPIIADTAEEAARRLFEYHVYDPARRRPPRKKNSLVRSLRDEYMRTEMVQNLHWHENVLIEAGRYHGKFDFAVTNGVALQLTSAWSFPEKDYSVLDRIKSLAWTISHAKDTQGVIEAYSSRYEMNEDTQIVAVSEAPTEHSADVYSEAKALFEELDIVHMEAAQLAEVPQHGAALLKRARGETPLVRWG